MAVLVSVVCVNAFMTRPPVLSNRTPAETAAYYLARFLPTKALAIYSDLVDEDSTNIDYHYGLITAHFSQPRQIRKHSYDAETYGRNDDSLRILYASIAKSPDPVRSDIGYYGLGLIESLTMHDEQALSSFANVRNRSLKYLNNSIGRVLLHQIKQSGGRNVYNTFLLGEQCFRKELAQTRRNTKGAYDNLLSLFVMINQIDSVRDLLRNEPIVLDYAEPRTIRIAYFISGGIVGYIGGCIRTIQANVDPVGFCAALLVLIAWLIFLRQIDVFHSEKWIYIVGTCLSAMTIVFMTLPAIDSLDVFGFTSSWMPKIFYDIISVGVYEELLKILPLLIGMRFFQKEIQEPVDLIIYASVSALGFAFIENLFYFNQYPVGSFTARALQAVVLHMVCSSLIAYYMIQSIYGRRWKKSIGFLYGLFIAAVIHGLYDFMLDNDLSVVSYVLVLLLLLQYGTMIGDALRRSPFYREDSRIDTQRLRTRVGYMLTSVFLLEYLATAYLLGAGEANERLIVSLLSGVMILVVMWERLFVITMEPMLPFRQKASVAALSES